MYGVSPSNRCGFPWRIAAGSWTILIAVGVSAAVWSAALPEDAEDRYPGGAPLKTDPELERLLTRAEQFADEGRYDLAAILWQKVLEESGDTLMTRDGRHYTALAEEVERTIAKLPADGLRVYRITADGEAKAILVAGQGEKHEEALAAVVRKYFLSSHGDDAAFQLGCLALDRYDFIGASRLFAKIIHQHPDPSMPMAELWLRLAVAAGHIGDTHSASEALGQLADAAGPKPADSVLNAVRQDLQRVGIVSLDLAAAGDWPMSLGNSSRRGHMRSLPDAVTRATLTKMWNYSFTVSFTGGTMGEGSVILPGRRQNVQPLKVARSDQDLIHRWKNAHWMPAGEMLVWQGRVYFKTNNDLTCWNAAAETDQPLWRTAWLNNFQLDAMTEMLSQMYRNLGAQVGQQDKPISQAEVMLFGDRIHQAMSISHGMIYSLEGRRIPRYGGSGSPTPTRTHWQWGVTPRRSRVNWLAAYEADTGKAKWYRSALDDEQSEASDVGFMAAPVPFGNLLLVPVTDSGTMWLYALDRRDGSTVWKTYLCDEPAGGCKPWTPIGVSVDGRDAYVVCGAGVVFALDAVSGNIRFAVRYQRSGKPSQFLRNFGYVGNQMLDLDAWEDDVVIPFGRQLVVMASDHDRLFAIDRRSGDELWVTPRTPNDHAAAYCLGVAGSGLFVGGRNCVRRYDLDKDGKLMWETVLGDSFGRGVLTSDALYVPVNDSIVRIDLNTGRVTNQVGVHLSTSQDPVGNLYSDGEKLWVIAGNQVFALTNRDQRLLVLNERIKAGNSAAYLERMQLYAKDRQLDLATEDLLSAYDVIARKDGPDAAFTTLFDGLITIALPALRPQETLEILAARCVDPEADAPAKVSSNELAAQLDVIVTDALRAIGRQAHRGLAPSIIKMATIFEREHQQALARQALLAALKKEDGDLLRAAAASRHAAVQIVVAEPLAQILADESKPLLQSMLRSTDAQVRYAAARGLASLGDRASLTALVELLQSGDPRIRLQSVHVLRSLTGQKIDFDPYGDARQRAAAVERWRQWVASEGSTVWLHLPLPETEPMLGRTLIAYYARNRLVELDADHSVRWEKQFPGVWAVQGLPNGHRLVSLYAQNAAVEFDEEGKEVWRKDRLPGNAFSVQRLQNGNTLVACSNNQLIEIDPAGQIAWQITLPHRPMHAERLVSGNTLVALVDDHRVVEIDSSGKVVWEIRNMYGPISAQRLDNGNTLIVQMNSGRVVEVNTDQQVVWQADRLTQPYDAQRLPNGNTLIAESNGLLEVDVERNRKYLHREQGASGVSRF